MDLSDQRMSYEAEGIDFDAMDANPIVQFESWFAEAQASVDPEPYAMVLSTVTADGAPQGRTVLLRGVDDHGFVFFTNYTSAKGQALDATNRAALTFHWHGLHRQVHVEGAVERVTAVESDAYFAKRPRESQLGAWASDQSATIESRSMLLDRLDEVIARFDGQDVPRPDFWGGYRVIPSEIEFWQGQPSRLHDRLRYRSVDGEWTRAVLSP